MSQKYAKVTEVRHWGGLVPVRLFHGDLGDLYANESVQKYLQQLVEEHRDISRRLQHECLSESDRRGLAKKHSELLPLANVFGSIEKATEDLEEVLSLLHSE